PTGIRPPLPYTAGSKITLGVCGFGPHILPKHGLNSKTTALFSAGNIEKSKKRSPETTITHVVVEVKLQHSSICDCKNPVLVFNASQHDSAASQHVSICDCKNPVLVFNCSQHVSNASSREIRSHTLRRISSGEQIAS